MDYPKVLTKYYIDKEWTCGDTYETIVWYEKTEPKPTQEHLESLRKELKKKNMREERNQLLKDCDFRVLSDYPDTNKEAWVLYRHNLRILPETWSEDNPEFPTKPE